MATRRTRYLGLILTDTLTADARANLEKVDLIGATSRLRTDGALHARSAADVVVEPDCADVGGAGTAGTVTIGHESNNGATILLKGTVKAAIGAGLLDQGAAGTRYLYLKYKSDVTGSTDVSADRNLSIDMGGADRSLALAGNVSLTGALATTGGFGLTFALSQAGAFTLPNQATGTLVSNDAAATLTAKVVDADANTLSNVRNANVAANAAIALSKLAALTASRAVYADASGILSASATTSAELGYLSGVTSALQTQLNNKASISLDNLSIASLAAGDFLVATSGTAVARFAKGTTNGYVLQMVAGSPAWGAAPAGAPPTLTGTSSAPTDVVAASGLTVSVSALQQMAYVQGAGGSPADVVAIPQVSAGSIDGQLLTIVGCSDAAYVEFHDGTGLSINGYIRLIQGSTLSLLWDSTAAVWREIGRKEV